MGRKITCTNHNGSTMIFDTEGFKPFLLAKTDGLYETQNNVSISDNTMTDGGTYQGSVSKKRNIVLTIMDEPNNVFNQRNRDALYVLFAEGTLGTLTYEENGNERTIDYYVEKIYKGLLASRLITISLLCADPFFYDKDPTVVRMAAWLGDFEFPHEFVAVGEELGHRSVQKIVNVVNDTATNNVGMTITLEALGAVTNPRITRIEDDTHIQLGSQTYPFVMQAGDVVIITTQTNNKHIILIRGAVKTEINEHLTEDSTFIQLMRGNNNIGYSASDGEDYLAVQMQYRMKYEGA